MCWACIHNSLQLEPSDSEPSLSVKWGQEEVAAGVNSGDRI